jgi:aminoglycoside phosphotransferase
MVQPNNTALLEAAKTFLAHNLPGEGFVSCMDSASDTTVWRIAREDGVYYLKFGPVGGPSPVTHDIERLRWLAKHGIPSAAIVAADTLSETTLLLMRAVRGEPARMLGAQRETDTFLHELCRALTTLHTLDPRTCPFVTDARACLQQARLNVSKGWVDAVAFESENAGKSPPALLNELAKTQPSAEDKVVTHGDPTLDNLMIDSRLHGIWIDVGRLGVCDRHRDLSIVHRNLANNVSRDAAENFLDLYGRHHIDEERLTWYRNLDEFF